MKNLNNLYVRYHPNGIEVLATLPEHIDVHKNEDLNLFLLIFNNKIELKVNLIDEDASCTINCVYLTAEAEKCHIRFDVNHQAPHTKSTQLIKGIVTDTGYVNFEGTIRMPQDSQKCTGMQNHRGLILSEKAHIQATPELEIYADDVQCAHGSAVGPLNKSSLFYLMARGIDETTAKKMLAEAFVLDLIPEEYHETAHLWLNKHI